MRFLSTLTEPLTRVTAAAQNAVEIARFGGLQTAETSSPYEVVAQGPVYRLRHYFAEDGSGPAVILIPPLMLSADVYDVNSSAGVAALRRRGIDPWVVDFGRPEHEPDGLQRRLQDHVLAVRDAISHVAEATGGPSHLAGYSQGGMFAYQATAMRKGDGVASIVTFGSQVDARAAAPFGLPIGVFADLASAMSDGPLSGITVPAWASRSAFLLIDPKKTVRNRVDFLMRLHDREALLPRERQRRFLASEGYVAWPGPAVADLMSDVVSSNRMLHGGLVVEGQLVTLADLTLPILVVSGTADTFSPGPTVRGITRAAPRADVHELEVPTGHFGLVVGTAATETVWPTVADWVMWRSEAHERPAAIRRPVSDERALVEAEPAPAGLGPGAIASAGAGLAQAAVTSTLGALRGLGDLSQEAALALPRLARLERIQDDTRISMALLLAEHAKRNPDDVIFLYGEHAYTHAAAKRRLDSVVAGLVSVGVRQGEHVGVLMGTRPSAFMLVAALNRLGAVSVLLRPDGDLERETRLGAVTRVVTDPDHVDLARGLDLDVLVLGGGAEPRDLGDDVIDMERIDPDTVELPPWYQPNPGRASDVAFVLFSGSGPGTTKLAITNARWALSAFGTASAGALTERDTLYTAAPIHHSSSLLVTLGGAIAGGSRVALSEGFDPSTFWVEVRRYGVTVVSYTWAMLHGVVDAPPSAHERHHPLRLLLGSGMPVGLWERVAERLAPARIVEFYASAKGDVVLVNLDGIKPGCVGRPLPGAALVRVVAWDTAHDRLAVGPDGLAVSCARGETGMLIAQTDGRESPDGLLRSVFTAGDAWVSTGDLFRRDEDGDLWLVEAAAGLVSTAHGRVGTAAARSVLERVDALDLVAVHGQASDEDPGRQELVAAVTLRPGRKLGRTELEDALSLLPAELRPVAVKVLDAMPLTASYRPDIAALQR